MINREFHYQDATSSKFWRIAREGSATFVQFGRIGSEGQTQTKTYPDEQVAELAYNKQIAEKLKKGYHEVGIEQALTTPPVPSAKSLPPPVVSAGLTEATLSLPLIASPELSTRVELDPTDWLWATWRTWRPLERPAAPAFDKADALRRLASISNDGYQWRWNWDRAEIPTVPSREEAHFWLTAMRPNSERSTPKQIAQSLADKQFSGKLAFEQAFALVDNLSHYARPIVTALAAAFGAPAALVVDIVRRNVTTGSSAYANSQQITAVLDGFRLYVLPYLGAVERQQLSQILAPHLIRRTGRATTMLLDRQPSTSRRCWAGTTQPCAR
jgi:predicted DNA-binding WGR domain protein